MLSPALLRLHNVVFVVPQLTHSEHEVFTRFRDDEKVGVAVGEVLGGSWEVLLPRKHFNIDGDIRSWGWRGGNVRERGREGGK